MKAIKNFTSLFFLCFLFALAAHAQQTGQNKSNFSTLDMNKDRRIDATEFNNTFRDNNIYTDWDANDDNRLDENEWNANYTSYYNDLDNREGLFDEWDVNNDSWLEENEYRDGTFDLWDENDDDFLDQDEYNNWYDRGLNDDDPDY